MNETSAYISVGTERLHYLQWGNGKRLLLAFHGYANEAALFRPMAQYLGREYTILSFDLPFHGGSNWTPGTLFTKDMLVALVATLKTQYNTDKVSLLGYSMGGRVCLTIMECMPQSVAQATLVAPDGLRRDPTYYFFTRTIIGKKLFRHMMRYAEFYIRFVGLLKAARLISTGRYIFVTRSLLTAEQRDFLQKVWPAMSDLLPHPQELKDIVRMHRLPISIFMGANDKIIPLPLARNFKKGLDTVHLHILKKGHHILDNDNPELIAQSLL